MNGPVQSAESIESTSEAPDNKKSILKRSSRNFDSDIDCDVLSDRIVSPDLSVSDDRNAGSNTKALGIIITALGTLWIIFPDFVPGPFDDIFVLLVMAVSNPGIRSLLGMAFRVLLIMVILTWITMPDICPGPLDDFLLCMLLLNLLPKSKR